MRYCSGKGLDDSGGLGASCLGERWKAGDVDKYGQAGRKQISQRGGRGGGGGGAERLTDEHKTGLLGIAVIQLQT